MYMHIKIHTYAGTHAHTCQTRKSYLLLQSDILPLGAVFVIFVTAVLGAPPDLCLVMGEKGARTFSGNQFFPLWHQHEGFDKLINSFLTF